MASLSDKETITRKTMIRKKQRSTGEDSSVWGRSKDELGQTGHARRMMRLILTQRPLSIGICPAKPPIVPKRSEGSGLSNWLSYDTCKNAKVERTQSPLRFLIFAEKIKVSDVTNSIRGFVA